MRSVATETNVTWVTTDASYAVCLVGEVVFARSHEAIVVRGSGGFHRPQGGAIKSAAKLMSLGSAWFACEVLRS